MTKKVVTHVITKYFYPVTAGIETNIMETYSILAKRGFEITIHTSKDTYLEKNSLRDEELIRGLKIKRYPYHWNFFWPRFDWNSADIVCLHNFDLVLFLVILLFVAFRKLAGQKNFSLVLTPHGGFTPDWDIFPPPKRLAKKFYNRIIGSFLINNLVDKMRSVSSWEKTEAISYGLRPDKVTVISNGTEDQAYLDVDKLASPKIKEFVSELGRYVIQVGRIYKIKNNETAIAAMQFVPHDVKLVLVGPEGEDKNYKRKLLKLVSDLKLEDRIILTGVIKGVDKYYLMRHAQAMVHMALWESYCNAIHEGMSQGLVCIVGDNTGQRDLIRDNIDGFRPATRDFKAVAGRINYVLENKDTKDIKAIQKRNKEFGLQDSWLDIALKMEKLYLSLIQ